MSVVAIPTPDVSQITLKISGRFDFSLHRDFVNAYREFPKGEKRFVVDLAEAEFLDSSAMGMLLILRDYAAKGDPRAVVIRNAPRSILEILKIANFHRLFVIE